MGRVKGIEPSTFGTTTRRSNQMSYTRHTGVAIKMTPWYCVVAVAIVTD